MAEGAFVIGPFRQHDFIGWWWRLIGAYHWHLVALWSYLNCYYKPLSRLAAYSPLKAGGNQNRPTRFKIRFWFSFRVLVHIGIRKCFSSCKSCTDASVLHARFWGCWQDDLARAYSIRWGEISRISIPFQLKQGWKVGHIISTFTTTYPKHQTTFFHQTAANQVLFSHHLKPQNKHIHFLQHHCWTPLPQPLSQHDRHSIPLPLPPPPSHSPFPTQLPLGCQLPLFSPFPQVPSHWAPLSPCDGQCLIISGPWTR